MLSCRVVSIASAGERDLRLPAAHGLRASGLRCHAGVLPGGIPGSTGAHRSRHDTAGCGDLHQRIPHVSPSCQFVSDHSKPK